MIKKLLGRISRGFSTPDGEVLLHKYKELEQHEGWKVHQGLLIQIANELLTSLVTEEFTKLSKEEKDTIQRSIFLSKEVIDFLLNPTKGLVSYRKLQYGAKEAQKGATKKT